MALSTRAKGILVLMLLEASIPIGSMVAFALFFGQGVPAFVYVIPVIWIALFVLSFARLRWAITGAIIMATLGIIIPVIPAALKVPNPLAQAVGLPICPFALAGIVVSIVIIPLAFKTLAEA